MISIEIPIRSIQHYMYCPHRWGLIEIGKVWAENIFVTKANLMHKRAHDPDKHYTLRGKKVYTSVPVYNDNEEYNLYGVLDCLELTESKVGVHVDESDKKYELCIVEYKPRKPKDWDYNEEDLMQIYAQKICLDYIFGCDSDAVIYYADVKKRVSLPLKENFREYDMKLKLLLREMREALEKGLVPPIIKGQKCGGCSMKDLCIPGAKKSYDFRAELEKCKEAPWEKVAK